MKRIAIALMILVQSGTTAFSQTSLPYTPKMDTIVEHAVQRFVQAHASVGLSAGVIHHGKTYMFNYGTTSGKPLYEIGSVTKTFTSLLLAQAILEKRVKPEDDIRKYLRGSYPNLGYAGKPIQLIHLVNLTSGLPDNMPASPEAFKKLEPDSIPYAIINLHKGYTKEKLLHDLHNVQLDTVPGLNPRHSNTAALLLTFILENIYGQSYAQLVRKYITGPLQMNNTFVSVPANKVQLLAKGFSGKGAPMPYIPDHETVLKSTITDMTNYMRYHLEEKDAAVKLTHKNQWGDINEFALGMNWFMRRMPDGKLRIADDGTTFGFTTYLLMYPEQQFGVVLMTNMYSRSSNDELGKMAEGIFEVTYFTPEERASDAFRFSASIQTLLKELHTTGFDHATEAVATLKKRDPRFNLNESEVNIWGYFLSGRNEDAKALEIFKLNVALYPNSWNVYDSYGELLLKMGQKEEAIKMYKRSIELNPGNDNGKKVLEQLSKP